MSGGLKKARMRIFRLLLILTLVVGLGASGMAIAADGGRGGGGPSGGSHQGGGPGGGYPGGHGGGGHDGHHGGPGPGPGPRPGPGGGPGPYYGFDVMVGGPLWGPPWYGPYYYPYYYPGYYPDYYYPYVPTEQSLPQEYIERSRRERSSRSSGFWYYCPESRAYYPYVRRCPGGWQKVPSQPPPDEER